MRMQESEQWQSPEETGPTYQNSGASYRETGRHGQAQKVYPQETLGPRRSVLGTLTLVFSFMGLVLTSIGIFCASIILDNRDRSQPLLGAGELVMFVTFMALLLFGAIFVFSVISMARQTARRRRPRLR